MPDADDPKLFDVRTLEQRLRRGLIQHKDYERYLKALANRADNAVQVGWSPPGSGSGDSDDADED